MRLTDNSGTWDRMKSWKGKYKKFEVNISQGSNDPLRGIVDYYYFYTSRDEDRLRHNSLSVDNKFSTLEEAEKAAIKWIDDNLKALK